MFREFEYDSTNSRINVLALSKAKKVLNLLTFKNVKY